MVEKKIDAVPVVGGANQLVGLVTSTDLLLLISREEAKIPLPFDWRHHQTSGLDGPAPRREAPPMDPERDA